MTIHTELMPDPVPVHLLPDEMQQEIAVLRKQAADEIDRLLAFLDAVGAPEEDLEDENLKEEDEDLEEDGSSEPELGAPERHPAGACLTSNGYSWGNILCDQTRWADGDDDEDEHDGCEPDDDGEPSLGALNNIGQTHWGNSALDDSEFDPADKEPSLGWTVDGAVSGRNEDEEAENYARTKKDVAIRSVLRRRKPSRLNKVTLKHRAGGYSRLQLPGGMILHQHK